MYFRSCAVVAAFVSAAIFADLSAAQSGPPLETPKDRISYSLGVQFGKALEYSQDDVDIDTIVRGIKDAFAGGDFAMDEAERVAAMAEIQAKMKTNQQKALAGTGQEYLDAKAKEDGVIALPSGLLYKVIRKGTGASPKPTDKVETHYRGTFADGKQFDSSYDRGQPAQFPVNRVIAGWTEALQLMKEGGKWELYIPYDLAYGAQGRAGIPAYSTLIFELELLRIVN